MCNDLKHELRKRILHEYFAGSRIIDIMIKLLDEYELDEYDIKKILNDELKEIITKQELKLNNIKVE